MRILKEHDGKPKVSIILLDWGVRESFHSLDYLNDQSVPRDNYELIWIEFYEHVHQGLRDKVGSLQARGLPGVDQWIVIGADREIYFHKHFAYNTGIALALGDICLICDSDVIFPHDFVQRIIEAFMRDPKIVLHVDEIRNANPRFFPFTNADVQDIINDPMTINWDGVITTGLREGADILHEANYGACMAARRKDLLEIGGADEHLDYLGYICGPYEMTFRLINYGRRELWLRDLFLLHTWHPGEGGDGNLGGPHDGRGMSLRALEAKASGRVMSLVENPVIRFIRGGRTPTREQALEALRAVDLSPWRRDSPRLKRVEPPKLIREGVQGHNIVLYDRVYYAIPASMGPFLPDRAKNGAYSDLKQDKDCDRLLARMARDAKAVRTRSAPRPAPAPLAFSEIPVLIREGVAEHNIILFRDLYYAFPQSLGPFRSEEAVTGRYAHLPHGIDLERVVASVSSSQGIDERLRRLARSVLRRLVAGRPD